MRCLYVMIALGLAPFWSTDKAAAQAAGGSDIHAAVQKLYEMTMYQARVDTAAARRLAAVIRREFPDTSAKARQLLSDLDAEVAKPDPNTYRLQTLASELAWVLDPEPTVPIPKDLDDD
jgi:hypothetical protein